MTFIKTDLSKYNKSGMGTYTGDSSVNRAIPHGLGGTPKIVIIISDYPNAAVGYISDSDSDRVMCPRGDAGYAVTPMDGTNFYVGNNTNYTFSMNLTTDVHRWVAFE